MNKQISLLNGLAILGVLISHAAGWGQTAMADWAAHIQATVDPSYTLTGSLPYYVLMTIRQFAAFSVAGFLVTSGWFITYAVGRQPTLSWKVVRARLVTLLIPYLIWSVISFAADYARGIRPPVWEYFITLVVTKGPYFFVPLLCYLYLLSPFLIPWARSRGTALLIAAGVIQLAAMSLEYMIKLGVTQPAVVFINNLFHDWAVPRWIFYYVFALVSSLHAEAFRTWVLRVEWLMLALIIPLGALAVAECDFVFRTTGGTWGNTPIYLMVSLLSMAMIISFLAFTIESQPVSQALRWLAGRSYGLYLIHSRVMGVTGLVFERFVPALSAQPLVFVPLQFVAGLAGPLLLMAAVSNTPARKYYRHIFG